MYRILWIITGSSGSHRLKGPGELHLLNLHLWLPPARATSFAPPVSPSYKIGFLDTWWGHKLSFWRTGQHVGIKLYQTLESPWSTKVSRQSVRHRMTHVGNCVRVCVCMPLSPRISNLKHIHQSCSRSSLTPLS